MKLISLQPQTFLTTATIAIVLLGCKPEEPAEVESQNVVVLTEEAFDEEVLQSTIPVAVDFWASWCGPCKRMAPVFADAADRNVGLVKFAKVDVDDQPALAQAYGIRAIPTVLFFEDGQVVDKAVGWLSHEDLAARLTKLTTATVLE